VSFLEKLKSAKIETAAQATIDPWLAPLERVRGKVDFDGFERVSSQHVLDFLEVPQHRRKAGTFRHLAKLMTQLGWSPVRVRDLTRGGYTEQIRGYCRAAQERKQ
jgi:hypothetical protein